MTLSNPTMKENETKISFDSIIADFVKLIILFL